MSSRDGWLVAVARLLDLGEVDGPEELCARAVARGHLADFASQLQSVAQGERDPWLEGLALEARSRAGDPALMTALLSFNGGGNPTLLTWRQAILVDHLLTAPSLDLMAHLDMSLSGDESALASLSRLRVQRGMTVFSALIPGQLPNSLRSLVIIEESFRSIGADEEASNTRCVHLALRVLDEQPVSIALAREVDGAARAVVRCRGDRALPASLLAVGAAHLALDSELVNRWRSHIQRDYGADSAAGRFAELLDCLANLRASPSPDLSRALDLFADVAGRYPYPWLLVSLAQDLLDFGAVDPAQRALALAGTSTFHTVQTTAGIGVLRLRVAIAEDEADNLPERSDSVIDHYVDADLRGMARVVTLRLCLDCTRHGLREEASRLRARLDSLQGDEALTPREAWLLAAVDDSSRRLTNRGALRLLQPRLQAECGGQPQRVGDLGAKLLALLITEGPRISAEWTTTALWPDADPSQGRNRLNVLIHRLRERLRLEDDELVLRDGDQVVLQVGTWWIDVLKFQEGARAANPDSRRLAAGLYETDLLSEQFPYDEELLRARNRLRRLREELLASLDP